VIAGFHDEGHGFDLFGLQPAAVELTARLARPLYDHYFRVRSLGTEHIPATGRAILVANHSGVLPVDGAMLWLDVLRHTGRVTRMVADRFIPRLPFVSTMFARTGVVSGTRANVRRMLERDVLLAIFPEGVSGVAKPRSERYRLQQWRVGHVELALRHRTPIIPVAIVGAEESWPVLLRLRGIRLFGAPYLPIPLVPLPLPVRYHLRYGPPIELHRDLAPELADDPSIITAAAARTRAAVEELLAETRAARKGLL
jgi:1-acyl-sn-glycerol-3-phosphate acyltransferase